MSTHSNILAWEIPCVQEPGGLHIVHGVPKESDTTQRLKKPHFPTDLSCPRQPGHTFSHRLGSPSQPLTCSSLSSASPNTSFLPFKSPFSSAVKSQFKHSFFQENFLVTTCETSDQCQSPTSKSTYRTAARQSFCLRMSDNVLYEANDNDLPFYKL